MLSIPIHVLGVFSEMRNLLLFLLVILAIYYVRRIARKSAPTSSDEARTASGRPIETMKECAHCGVLVPASEGFEDSSGAFFCCAEHARQHRDGSAP